MKYEELTDKQKERARDWYRQIARDSSWYEGVYDDAIQVAALLGIEIGEKQWRATNGRTGTSPAIYFSGFWSQGDGACFEGKWQGYAGMVDKVKEYAPQDETLHRIARDLQVESAKYDHRVSATTKHSGHYYHSGCMDIEFDDYEIELENGETVELDDAAAVNTRHALRAFADWIYRQLEAESEAQDEDSYVEEQILANDYDFDVGTGGIRI